ncbi:MAG: amidohydrolase family protein, partial [Spirochaetes bacterium]|nr:amidohydrolase family protein [Spirochaetota bacterium]
MIVIEKVPLLHFSPGSVSEPVDIVIDGGLIKAVGRDAGKNWPEAERHAPGGYVSPGLVCSHNHFYSMLARGLNVAIKPSKDFAQQLDHMWWRLDRALDEEIVRASGLSAAAEALFSGVTSVVDHHASPSFIEGSLDVLKEGFDTTGLRGLLCYETTDRNGKAGARAGVAENRRFAKAVDA